MHYHTGPRLTDQLPLFNLSHVPNISALTNIIALGTKHVPIPRDVTDLELSNAAQRFYNSVSWQAHLVKHPPSNDDLYNPILRSTKPTRDFVPGRNPAPLKLLLAQVLYPLRHFSDASKARPYRSPQYLKQLSDFKRSHPELILQPADKNLGTTLMHITLYNSMVTTHLANSTNYRLISNNSNNNFALLSLTTARAHFLTLGRRICSHLQPDNPQIKKYMLEKMSTSATYDVPFFYVLPKLHKNKHPIPSRPLVAAVNWITTPISVLLGIMLLPVINEYEHILTNAYQLTTPLVTLEIIEDLDWLVTVDIESLYTSIDTRILSHILQEYHPDGLLSEMSDFINDNNFFQYDGRVFKQQSGIAMGTNAAPMLANLYLIPFDSTFDSNSSVKLFRRYLDDVFFIFRGTEADLLLLLAASNKAMTGIRTTFEYSRHTISYLDLQITMDHQIHRIRHSPHQKLLNRYQYLTQRSCHPPSTFRGFILGELTRYARLSSDPSRYYLTRALFRSRLLLRGYKPPYLDAIFKTHSWSWRSKIKPAPVRLLPLVIPYTLRPQVNDTAKASQRHKLDFRRFIPDSEFSVVFSKTASLGSYVSKSRISTSQSLLLSSTNDVLFPDINCLESSNIYSRRFGSPTQTLTSTSRPIILPNPTISTTISRKRKRTDPNLSANRASVKRHAPAASIYPSVLKHFSYQ